MKERYDVRQLDKSDYDGYMRLINIFRPSNRKLDTSLEREREKEDFERTFDMAMTSGCIWIACASPRQEQHLASESDSKQIVVGTITVHIEQKFIHNFSYYARIEDLFVMPKYRGQGIAGVLMKTAKRYCKEKQIRKLSLTCTDDLVSFYERHDIKTRRNDMSAVL